MAIHAVQGMPTPVLLRLDVVGVGLITIDARHHAYAGDIVPATFPAHPAAVLLETRAAPPGDSPVLGHARDLDGLLWMIGAHAFGEQPATWLWPEDRYRLSRWPNLGSVAVGMDEVRMFGMLANVFATPAELAAAVGCALGTAQRAINALSLMGILRTSAAASPPEPAPMVHRGLFQRLRDRLGI